MQINKLKIVLEKKNLIHNIKIHQMAIVLVSNMYKLVNKEIVKFIKNFVLLMVIGIVQEK